MALTYYAFSDNNYTTLRLSGINYPAGRIRGTIDFAVDMSASTAGWQGPWHNLGSDKTTTIIIEDPIEVKYADSMFYDLRKVTTIRGFDNITGGVVSASRMFAGMSSLRYLYDNEGNPMNFELPRLRVAGCEYMNEMFKGIKFIDKINLQNFDMRNCHTAEGMFEGSGFETIDMQMIPTTGVNICDRMFANCTNLTTIYGTESRFDFSNATSSTDMFTGSTLLPNYPGDLDNRGAISVALGGHVQIQIAPQIIANTRIREKYDTAANWAYHNPLLMKGEIAIDSTNKMIKVGDGVQKYNDLPYYNSWNVDHITLERDSEGTAFVLYDDNTIIVGSEGLQVNTSAAGELVSF